MPQISYYAKHMLSSEDSRAPPLCSLISRKAIKNICGSDCDDVYVPAIDGWHIRTCEHADIQTHHMCVIVPRTLGNISASINCLGHSSLKTAIIYTYNRWNRCATPLILSRTRRHLSTVKSVHPVRVFLYFCSAFVIVIIILPLITPDIHDFSVGDFLLLPRCLHVHVHTYTL